MDLHTFLMTTIALCAFFGLQFGAVYFLLNKMDKLDKRMDILEAGQAELKQLIQSELKKLIQSQKALK